MVTTNESRARILVSNLASFDVVDYSAVTLKAARALPWEAEGRTGGRNGRPRLSVDGNYVYGSLAAPVPGDQWQTRQNDIHIVNLKDETVKRLPLAVGIVGRFQLSAPYALFTSIHPDGDYAILFDTDPASRTFQTVVARIPLTKLANAPQAGQLAAGTEARGAAITPDGRWALVSHGGEGMLSVIDTSQKVVVRTVTVPTPLKGGGYMLAYQAASELTDTQVR